MAQRITSEHGPMNVGVSDNTSQLKDHVRHCAGVVKAAHPDFRYQPLAPPEVIGDAGRVRWVSGSPDKPPAYAGTDFIIARDGKIAAVYLFFDELP
jgi:hypothetical protein